jgi:hypothetical protein
MANTYVALRDDFNSRTLRLCSDLFKLTNNANFQRLSGLITHDIEARQPALILWKHINNVNPEHVQRVLDGDVRFFVDDSFDDERCGSLIQEFRSVWKTMSAANQKIVLVKLQNIFRIAERIRTEFYDDVVRDAVMQA